IFRFLLGLGIGADYPISATLVSEFSSDKGRGKHGTFLGAMWFVGAVTAYIFGLILEPLGDNAWRYMLLVGAVFALIIFHFRIERPAISRLIASKRRKKAAQEVMKQSTSVQSVIPPQPEKKPKVKVRDLLSKQLTKRTIFVNVFRFSYATAYFGIS